MVKCSGRVAFKVRIPQKPIRDGLKVCSGGCRHDPRCVHIVCEQPSLLARLPDLRHVRFRYWMVSPLRAAVVVQRGQEAGFQNEGSGCCIPVYKWPA
jgi:hypothetical protein